MKSDYPIELLYEVQKLISEAARYRDGVPMRQLYAQQIIELVLEHKGETNAIRKR